MGTVDLIAQTLGAHMPVPGRVGYLSCPCDREYRTGTEHAAHQAQAVTEALGLVEHESWHNCTPGCPDGCDVAKVRWGVTPEVVIERRQPLTDEQAADLRARIDAIRAAVRRGGAS